MQGLQAPPETAVTESTNSISGGWRVSLLFTRLPKELQGQGATPLSEGWGSRLQMQGLAKSFCSGAEQHALSEVGICSLGGPAEAGSKPHGISPQV